jgi:hypothetical protein
VFRSLQSRLFLTYLLVAGLVLLFVAVSLLFLLLRSPSGDQRVYLSLERSLPTIARGQGRLLLELEGEELNSTIERMDQMSGARVIIINPRVRFQRKYSSRAERVKRSFGDVSVKRVKGSGCTSPNRWSNTPGSSSPHRAPHCRTSVCGGIASCAPSFRQQGLPCSSRSSCHG